MPQSNLKFIVRKPYEGEDLDSLERFDFTKLSSINTCPTFGILRYGRHKIWQHDYEKRIMPLEAGSACHEVFAAARMFDAGEYGHRAYGVHLTDQINTLVHNRAYALFGEERADRMFAEYLAPEDERTRLLRGALYILETSGFYDDPSDKRRTLTNLEEACIAYLDRLEFGRNVPCVHLENGEQYIGIEMPIDLVIEYEFENKGETISRKIRFVGLIDGVHCYRNDPQRIYVEDNKTGARLGDAWEQSFEMSHQMTGYTVAATVILGTKVDMVRVRGVAIPQPRIYEVGGISTVTCYRKPHQYEDWAKWVVHTVEQYFLFKDDPTEAPKYTHSCNRYYHACMYIPLCSAPPNERREMLDEMAEDEWNPLHDKYIRQ